VIDIDIAVPIQHAFASRRLMFFKSFHLVRSAGRLAVATAALVTLSGCQAIISTPPTAELRIIDASPDAPGLDIYEGTTALAYNLGFGTLTSYIPMSPGTYTFSADTTGSKQVLSSSKATLVLSNQYTILIGNSAASLQQITLTDQSEPAPSGQISLRFIDQATRVGAVDIYLVPASQKLTAVSPVATDIIFGTNTGYLNVPMGTYTLVMVPAGTVPTSTTIATYTGAQVTYSGGAARTIVLIDQQLVSTPGLQVIKADDFDSPTATS
jgi:hypothetical protein